MDDAMTHLISNLHLVACYVLNASRAPVQLTKSPAVRARIAAYKRVRAFQYGREIPADTADVLLAYCSSSKVVLTDFGTSIVVQVRYGRGTARAADTRFVVCA